MWLDTNLDFLNMGDKVNSFLNLKIMSKRVDIGDETGDTIAAATLEELEKFQQFGVYLPRDLCPGHEYLSLLPETQKVIDLIKEFRGNIAKVLELLELSLENMV